MISIVVPIYKVEKYLAKCLDSLVNQTYPDIEIILVDDGSPDESSRVYEKYAKKDSRITIIKQENQGLSGARNTGIKAALGEYIMFVDSDDWIELDTCEKALIKIQKNKADVVFWSYIREYPDAQKTTYLFGDTELFWDVDSIKNLHRRIVGLVGGELREPQKIDALVTAWGKLYRKEIIEGCFFTDTKKIGTEDALYNIQVFSKVKRAVYLPEPMSHYRKENTSSLSHQYKRKLAGQWKELYSFIEQFLDDMHADEEFYKALNNRICLGLIGIGLNLAEDSSMCLMEKYCELKTILGMPHYVDSLSRLELCFFPVHWRAYFFFAKKRLVTPLLLLLYIMNGMRGK